MSTIETKRPAPRRERGMSLIEILVGVVIGLLGILVIFQVLAVSEDRKRTTVHGSDAQSAGAIGLYQLQREVQRAGYGFGTADTKIIGCLVKAWNGAAIDFRLHPVEIVQGAAGAPDRIRVLIGSSDKYVTDVRPWTPSGANTKTMTGSRAGFDYGDLVVLTGNPTHALSLGTPELPCAMIQVTDRPTAQPFDVGHNLSYTLTPPDTLSPAATTTPRFNKDAAWPASASPPFAPNPNNGFALNLGKQPRRHEFRVTLPGEANPNRLVATELLFDAGLGEIADSIVNLQAEYGIDRNNNQVIEANEWTETPPDNTLIPTGTDPKRACGDSPSRSWRCVLAIRVALLARSAHWDKAACSPNPQRTSGATGALLLTNFAMTNVDGTAASGAEAACTEDPPSPNNWRRYRYSVYETVIPLRNMLWGTAP
jgi:type IV pilus assembly protein PilW